MRDKLPLFRNRTKGKSVLGLVIVVFILLLLGGLLNSFHSNEYLGIHEHEFVVSEQIDATCEVDGVINYTCTHCDETKSETVNSLGHELLENKKTEPSCENNGILLKKCIRCGYEDSTVLPAGHKMEEMYRVDATEKYDGEIIRGCAVCGKQETEVIKRIGGEYKDECISVSYEDISRNPDNYEGQKVVFRGELIQVQESEVGTLVYYTLRMNVTQGDYGIWRDTIYIDYIRSKEEGRLLEDDIVTVYGELKGIKTYTAVLGNSVSIPYLSAKYIELN